MELLAPLVSYHILGKSSWTTTSTILVSFFECVVFIFVASGLKCNSCQSLVSFEDCIKHQRETDCDHDEGYKCGKSHYKYKNEKDIYSLSCTSTMHCNDPGNMCRVSHDMSDCEVTCCDTDHCNAASLLEVSVVIVLPCVLGTLMMI